MTEKERERGGGGGECKRGEWSRRGREEETEYLISHGSGSSHE